MCSLPFSSLETGTGSVVGLCRDLGGDGSILQHSPATLRWPTAGPVMGFVNDRVDSISTCSKKMYLTAKKRASPKVITCSISMLVILGRDAWINSCHGHPVAKRLTSGGVSYFNKWKYHRVCCGSILLDTFSLRLSSMLGTSPVPFREGGSAIQRL